MNEPKEVNVEKAYQLLQQKSHILVDVREMHEWLEGRAQGAIHLPKSKLNQLESDRLPDKDQGILTICGGGVRSMHVAELLMEHGFKDVMSVAGGLRAWKAAKLPTED
ncbi:MAG: sulfurtransferase [Legionellales bacterium]|nr:sulfurtransferase [Legionellales bacterium]OUX66906.1 MAG: hypothetical protein CBD38_04045 [bacterium TMED178]|tara:strand:- start:6723 stop:7046 length:324 start_codon:yes stop_codon:yes gene_type:complete